MRSKLALRPPAPCRLGERTLRLTCAVFFLLLSGAQARAQTWTFTDVTTSAGLNYQHGYVGGAITMPQIIGGGVAVGDYDDDGFDDLFLVRGDIGSNLLFRNLGNGSFEEVAALAGVASSGISCAGPVFADYDGDGWLDLFVGGVEGTGPQMFRNLGDGTFNDATSSCGIDSSFDTFSAAFADHDRDGDLDVFLTHWSGFGGTANHLWRNNGNGTFSAIDFQAGIVGFDLNDLSFTPNFADINNDMWPDLLIASDKQASQVFLNDGDGTFTCDQGVYTDENGMGGSVADYDNDGDLDWFVSSIWEADGVPDGGWGVSGNRMYRNLGNGTFEDATDAAGVRAGHWGWGSSFADLNNDGHLDLLHVNGWPHPTFDTDPAVVFVANGDATFTERALELGLADTGQGRGVACFDYDRDGDLDVFIANNSQPPRLYRNDGGNEQNHLVVRLNGLAPNTQAIGARIYVTHGSTTQMRELACGSNFLSQNPVEAHFGMGQVLQADEVRIRWPGGYESVLTGVAVNQTLDLDQPGVSSTPGAFGSALHTLESVVPNPFRLDTRIRFRLAFDEHAELKVYDTAGRLVRTLADEHLPAGQHVIQWNGKSDAGHSVSRGIYLLRLHSHTQTITRKLLNIR